MEEIFIPKMKGYNIDVDMVLTKDVGHATELAKEYGSEETGLVIVGGDGTIHECLDGLLESNKLNKVMLGLLSQGTINGYYHSGRLPDVASLPDLIKKNSHRCQPLMKISDDMGQISTMCFEAIYMGLGYVPARGAQEWRKTPLGPFFGIIYNIFKGCLFPKTAAIKGKLSLYKKGETEPLLIEDEFFWIVITQRSPYSGTITENEMWVSYLRLKNFPGFSRMMDCFSPPMEHMSGLINIMEDHVCVDRFTFEQTEGNIGVCLDGDPMDGGKVLSGRHIPKAWNIVADREFPKRVANEVYKPRPPTACAEKFVQEHELPKGVEMTTLPASELENKAGSGLRYLFLGAMIVAGISAAYLAYTSQD